jgi:hypothetical protein
VLRIPTTPFGAGLVTVNFRERPTGEVRRIPLPRTGVAIDVGEMLKRRTVNADERAREAMARSGVSRI